MNRKVAVRLAAHVSALALISVAGVAHAKFEPINVIDFDTTNLAFQSAVDGAYSNLDQQIADAQAEVDVLQANFDAAALILADAQADYDALLADITPEEQALLDAVLAAQTTAASTQTALDTATTNLNAATLAESNASDAYNTAVQDRIDAEAALALDPTNATLAQALVDAEAAEADAQQAFLDATAAVAPVQQAFDDASAADTAADATLASATLAAGGVTPTTAHFATAQGAVDAAQAGVDAIAPALQVNTDSLASLNRAADVLPTAATNPNEAIADAAGALLGTVTDTDYQVEVVAALVDHETRITANADAIAAETDARIAGDAATLASANTYTDTAVSAEATARIAADTAEANARIAGDNALRADINTLRAVDNELRDRIASSTATAIALGGTAILPDTNFTLSGNGRTGCGRQRCCAHRAERLRDRRLRRRPEQAWRTRRPRRRRVRLVTAPTARGACASRGQLGRPSLDGRPFLLCARQGLSGAADGVGCSVYLGGWIVLRPGRVADRRHRFLRHRRIRSAGRAVVHSAHALIFRDLLHDAAIIGRLVATTGKGRGQCQGADEGERKCGHGKTSFLLPAMHDPLHSRMFPCRRFSTRPGLHGAGRPGPQHGRYTDGQSGLNSGRFHRVLGSGADGVIGPAGCRPSSCRRPHGCRAGRIRRRQPCR